MMVVTHEKFRSNSVYKHSATTAISYTTSDAFCLQKLDMYNIHSFICIRKLCLVLIGTARQMLIE